MVDENRMLATLQQWRLSHIQYREVTNAECYGDGKHRLDNYSESLVVNEFTSIRLDRMLHCTVWYKIDDDCWEHSFNDCQHEHIVTEELATDSKCIQLRIVQWHLFAHILHTNNIYDRWKFTIFNTNLPILTNANDNKKIATYYMT